MSEKKNRPLLIVLIIVAIIGIFFGKSIYTALFLTEADLMKPAAEEAVKQFLKAPSTAKFEYKFQHCSGEEGSLDGYVTSQNAFGVPIRAKVYVILEKSNGQWKATVVDIDDKHYDPNTGEEMPF